MDEPQNKAQFRIRLEARLKNSRLIEARENLHLTQEEVAHAIGVNGNTLGEYERMQQYPTNDIQTRICDFYRKRGEFMLEEEVFPPELMRAQIPRKMTKETEIEPQDLISFSNERRYRRFLSYEPTAEQMAGEEDIQKSVDHVLGTLAPRTEKILRMRFGIDCNEHKLEEIAEAYDLSSERIRQIEMKALRHLRRPCQANRLKDYYKL